MIWKPSAGLPHIKIVASLVLLLFFIRLRGGWARCIFLRMISSRLGRVLINAQIASLHGAGRPVLLWRWRDLPASAATGNPSVLPYLPPKQRSTLRGSEDVTVVTGCSSSTPLFFGRRVIDVQSPKRWTPTTAMSKKL